jgi:glutathione gamma-glutamylcysteinyltransferase
MQAKSRLVTQPMLLQEGVTLDQAACLGSCSGVNVHMLRSGDFSLQDFHEAVAECTASGSEHLIVSYARKILKQTGDGHFSPVGGYHPGRGLVLILDTARFKYPPHWVPLQILFEAMKPKDVATGARVGVLLASLNLANITTSMTYV